MGCVGSVSIASFRLTDGRATKVNP